MKLETITERLEKAEIKLNKKIGTIEKKSALIEKKWAAIDKLGVARDHDLYERDDLQSDVGDQFYWLRCDIGWLEDDLKRLSGEVEETKAYISKLSDEKVKALNELAKYEAMPEIMKNMESELVVKWDEFDKQRRDFMKQERNELGFTEFCKKHGFRNYDFATYTDEKIHNDNVRDAECYVTDLYSRIVDKTGEVTGWEGITCSGVALNGKVYGKRGAVRVETILAGGYNIQRLHCRTLVHEF